MYKGEGEGGVLFADFISFFLNIQWKWNNLVSLRPLRPNYFIFIGCLKTGAGEGVQVNPLNPLWTCHWCSKESIHDIDTAYVLVEKLKKIFNITHSYLKACVHDTYKEHYTFYNVPWINSVILRVLFSRLLCKSSVFWFNIWRRIWECVMLCIKIDSTLLYVIILSFDITSESDMHLNQ